MKNITKFTYKTQAFNGYRIAFQIKNMKFCKYVSATKTGNREALRIAKDELKMAKEVLAKPATWRNGSISKTRITDMEKEGWKVTLPAPVQ